VSDKNRQLKNFLDPTVLRPNLVSASIYISAFEILKAAIVDQIKDFYTSGFDENGWIIDPKYQSKVLSKNRSPVYASLEWLKDVKAIDDTDVASFERAKALRNALVHEPQRSLFNGMPPEIGERFGEMVSLLSKIERWWIVNVEIATDPDLIDEEIDEKGIIPGSIMVLRALVDIALGSDGESKQYIDGLEAHEREEGQSC
jgi:hypothetical protein